MLMVEFVFLRVCLYEVPCEVFTPATQSFPTTVQLPLRTPMLSQPTRFQGVAGPGGGGGWGWGTDFTA